MSRKHRRKLHSSQTSATDARKDLTPKGFQDTIEAARAHGDRALWWFPSLEPKDRMPTLTRSAINRNHTWLYENVPPVRTLIDGLALDEVDTGSWPKATTTSPEFNRAATNAFHEQCKDPRFFDAAGKENYYSAQMHVRRAVRLYGELFAQFLRPGDVINSPMVHFVPAWQCDNAAEDDATSRQEGIRLLMPWNRALDYRFKTGPNSSQIVPADDVLHQHDQFWTGQVRGIGSLAPAAKSLFRFSDIEKAETGSTLLRTKMAYQIVRKESGDDGPVLLPGAGKVEKIDVGDGNTILLQRIMNQNSDDLDVVDVPAGFDMKVLESNRAAMTIEFLNWLLNVGGMTSLYPSSYIFLIAGLTQGTLVRMVQKRVQRVKNTVRQFQLGPQFCDRWYVFRTWQNIKSGYFDRLKIVVPADWWAHKTIQPADDSVDIGREGKLYDARLETGKMSPETYHGMQGEDADDVEDEVIAAELRRARKIKEALEKNLDLADYFRKDLFASAKQANARVIEDPEEEEDPEEDDPKKKKKGE